MKKFLFAALAAFLACSSFAQPNSQKLDELVTAYFKSGKFNGSVLVAHKGNIVLKKGYGFRDAEKKIGHDAGSIFLTGSLTKQFTSLVVMQLVEEKKLSLKDPLSKFFKGFPNGDKITIEHLLTHQSGLFNYTSDSSIMETDLSKPFDKEMLVSKFKSYQPDFEPGSNWSYSNSGYSMLGYIIEKVTNKPYEKVVRERILQPLGMSNSGFDYANLKSDKKSTGYYFLSADTVVKAPLLDSTLPYAAGALYSTIEDFYKWDRGLKAAAFLKPASWKLMYTPQKQKYGLGWGIDTIQTHYSLVHTGGIPGFMSIIARFPGEDLTIIVMDNASGTSVGKIMSGLAAIAFNQPYEIPVPPSEMSLGADILQQYIGEYQLAPTFSINIFLEGTKLKAQATNQPSFELFAEKKDHFFLKVVDAKIEFVRNEKGEVTELILHQGGQSPRGKKIK